MGGVGPGIDSVHKRDVRILGPGDPHVLVGRVKENIGLKIGDRIHIRDVLVHGAGNREESALGIGFDIVSFREEGAAGSGEHALRGGVVGRKRESWVSVLTKGTLDRGFSVLENGASRVPVD